MSVAHLEHVNLLKLLENTNIGVVIHANDTSVVYANPTALRLLRLSYDQIIGKEAVDPQWKFVDENKVTLPIAEYPISRILDGQSSMSNTILGAMDGQHRDISWFIVNAYYEGERNSEHGFVVVSFTDITDRKQMFCFEDIVHDTHDVVIVTEAACLDRPLGPKIVYVNKAFERVTGYHPDEVLGETPRLLQGPDTCKETLQRIRAALRDHTACHEKILNYAKNGTPYWVDMHIFPLKNRFGEVTHFAGIERDITSTSHYEGAIDMRNTELRMLKMELETVLNERTQALRQSNMHLQRVAHEDSLTGIPNRKSFMQQSAQQLVRARRHPCCIGVAVVDADHFKRINDEFGHDVGDEALQLLALTLQHTVRQDDVIGRIGGEEFAICMLAANQRMIEESMARLCDAVRHACEGLAFSPLTVSIGLCCAREQYPGDLSALLKQADLALYQAKHAGRDRTCCRHYPSVAPAASAP